MTKEIIIEYLAQHKKDFKTKFHIDTLGLYGSYARNEASEKSDIDIFYESDDSFSMGLFELTAFVQKLEKDLHAKIDFVNLKSMNPLVKYYAKKDFIYV